MLQRFNTFLEKTVPFFIMSQFIFMAEYLIFMILPFPVLTVFYLLTPFLNIVLFLLYKDYVEDNRLTLNIFLIQITLFFISIPLYLLKQIEAFTDSRFPIFLKILLSLMALVFSFALILSNKAKIEERIEEVSIKEKLLQAGKGSESGYDVEVCIDKNKSQSVFLTMMMRFLHVLIIGPTGCGKTSQIIIPWLVQDISRRHGVIVLEPKADLALKAYAIDVYYNKEEAGYYFDPADPDCPYFNPLEGKETQVATNLTTIFQMLNQDSPTYYKDLARELITKSIKTIKRIERAYTDPETRLSSRPATLLVLNDLLQNTNNRGRNMINELMRLPTLKDSEKKENEDIGRWFLDIYWGDRDPTYKNTSGIRSQIEALIENEYLRKILNPPSGRSDINFDEIIASEGRLYITTNQGLLQELNAYLGYFLMFSIQAAIFRRDINDKRLKPCYWYLDEFQTYANSGFSTILQQGRGYKVSTILATQSQEGVSMGMGRAGDAFLSVVKTNARNKIIFPGIAQEDAEYFSKEFGEETHTVIQKGVTYSTGLRAGNSSRSEREVEEDRRRFTYSQIMYKKKKEITYRLIENDTVGLPGDGKVNFIDNQINDKLDEIVEEYSSQMKAKHEKAERERQEAQDILYSEFQKSTAFSYGSSGTYDKGSGVSEEEGAERGFGSSAVEIE